MYLLSIAASGHESLYMQPIPQTKNFIQATSGHLEIYGKVHGKELFS